MYPPSTNIFLKYRKVLKQSIVQTTIKSEMDYHCQHSRRDDNVAGYDGPGSNGLAPCTDSQNVIKHK